MNINKGWIGDIAAVMVCYGVLVFLCRAVLPKKYRYIQEKLSSYVMWASVLVSIIWLMEKRTVIDIIMKSLGLSRIELPFMQPVIRQAGDVLMRLSVNMAFGLFLAVYILFKMVWLLWKRRAIKKNVMQLKGICGAYEYNKTVENYVLRPEYVQQRKFYQILFLASGLLFGFVKCALEHTGRLLELFVMATALSLYLWEKLEYFSGCTLEEWIGQQKKEKKESLEARELISLLKETGKPYRLRVFQKEKEELDSETLSLELAERLMEIQLSDNYRKRCMGYEWQQTIKGRSDIHMELMEAALLLAEYQSLYITHVSYRELGPYIFPFLAMEILDNKKLLVVLEGQEEEELLHWLEAGLSGRVGSLKSWIAGRGQEIGDVDVGIVSFRYIKDAAEVNDSQGFFLQVSAVLFLNPSYLIVNHSDIVLKFLVRLHPGKEKLTYVVCDNNIIGMADWLSHACQAEFSVIHTAATGKEQSFAIVDRDAAALPERKGIFAKMVEDSCYHAAEMVRWQKNCTSGVAMVCSPHYMLREYMTFCMETGRKLTVHQILPELIRSERNIAIAVFGRLLHGSVEWLELKELAEYYGADVQKGLTWLLGSLNWVLAEILGLDCVWLTEDLLSQKEDDERRAVISTEEGRQQLNRWYQENIEFVVYKREGSQEESTWSELTAGCHVFQKHLPGQLVMIEGKYYRVGDIFLKQGRWTVSLKRSADAFQNRRYYRQLRNIALKEDITQPAGCMFQHGEVMAELCCGDLKIQTEGYLCSRRFYDVRQAEYRKVSEVPDRIYHKKKYLKITAQNQNCMWIGILLKEVFYTLFPHSWQLLCVAVGERWWKEELRGHVDVLTTSGTKEDRDVIYVIEDSVMDLGLVQAIGDQFERIRLVINEYVEWGNMEGKEEVREYFGDELLDKLRLTGI